MKRLVILLLSICPMLTMAQGHKGSVEACAPMKEGKVCYSDEVDVEGMKKGELFNGKMFSCQASLPVSRKERYLSTPKSNYC